MATNSTRNLSIRITVVGGDGSRKELNLTGETAERVAQKIKEAFKPASKELVALNVAGEQLRHGLEGMAGEAGSFGASLIRLGPAGLAAAAAIGTIVYLTKEGIGRFREFQQASNQFDAALKATGNAAGVTKTEILELAEAMERKTLFNQNDILKAAANLTAFGDIQDETFTRALKLSADLAVRLGTDLPTAADQLGAALENPGEGLGRLERKFKTLSPAQKEVIDQFVKQGDIASAQAIILDHLQGKTEGLAKSQTEGLARSTHELSLAWDDFLKAIGRTANESGAAQVSLGALTAVVRELQKEISPTLQQQKEDIEKQIKFIKANPFSRVDEFIFGGDNPALNDRQKALKKINDQIAAEQAKAAKEKQEAISDAEKEALDRRNDQLYKIELDFQKKFKEATQSDRDKIIESAEEAKRQIENLSKAPGNTAFAQKATDAIDAAKRAQLAKLDAQASQQEIETNQKVLESLKERVGQEAQIDPRKKAIQIELDKLSAGATNELRQRVQELAGALYDEQQATQAAKDAQEKRKKAIEEANRAIIETKPSFEAAKEALERWRDTLISALGDGSAESQRAIEQIRQAFEVKLKDAYYKSLLDSNKWEDGAVRALKHYAQEAGNAAKQAETAFGSAINRIDDFLTELLTTGEFKIKSFRQMLAGIQADFAKSFIKKNIEAPIFDAAGDAIKDFFKPSSTGGGWLSSAKSFIASLFHGGGVVGETPALNRTVPAHVFLGAPRFHNGLMPDEFPAILQRGETVIPKNQRMGGGMTVNFNISTPNAQSFTESRGQVLSKFAGEMQRMRVRNG